LKNLKKVHRKPHPIRQEIKTLADHYLQLDTVSDPVRNKYGAVDRNLIAMLKRLSEPWFWSGRTVVDDYESHMSKHLI
jgi:hypothetical protein